MMVNCPKCGFAQPDDQYCASCGVDMKSFRPVPKSIGSRLINSTFIQVLALVTIVSLGYSYVRYQKQRDLEKRIAEIETARKMNEIEDNLAHARAQERMQKRQQEDAASIAPPSAVKPANLAPTAAAAPAPSVATANAQNSEARSLTHGTLDTATVAPAAAPSGAVATGGVVTPATAALAGRPQVRLMFARVSRDYLTEIMQAGHDGTSAGPTAAVVVPKIEDKIKAGTQGGYIMDMDPAESAVIHPITFNQRIMVIKDHYDQSIDQNIGITVQLMPASGNDAESVHLQVDLMRTLRNTGATPPFESLPIQIPENFDVPRGSAVVVAGILPQHTPTADDTFYRHISALRILADDAYKNGAVDLALIIEAK